MTILSGSSASGTTTMPAVFDADEKNFNETIVNRSRSVPVVVDFWAPWCGPCRTLSPILERLAKESNGAFVLAKVNVDNNQRLAQMFRVQGIPAVKAIKDGRIVDQFEGALPESQVRSWLKRFTGPQLTPADEMAEEAAAIEATDPRGAESRYRAVLTHDPKHVNSQFGLGRLLAAAGDPEGTEILKNIPPETPLYARAQAWLALGEFIAEANESSPYELTAQIERNERDFEARYQLAAHEARSRRYGEAISQLLAIVERDRTFRQDGARQVLLSIFAALGDQNPLAVDGRRKLANLLF